MRVDDVGQVFGCALHLEGHHRFGNQFRRGRADDVHAENFAMLGVCHDLHEAVMRSHNTGARVRGEGELADLHVITLLFGLGLGQAHTADFRMAVRRVGNPGLVDRLGRLAGNVRDGDDAFHGSGVGQLRIAHGNISDGVDTGFGGPHIFIGFHETSFELDFGLFDADVFGARGAADGDQHLVGFQLLLLAIYGEGHGHTVFGALDLFDLGIHEAADAALAVDAHQLLRDLFVLHRHVARQHFEDGHVCAKRLVDAGELDAHGAGADHDQRLRNAVEAENFDVAQDAVVRLEPGEHACYRAGRENHGLGSDGGLAAFALDLDGVNAVLGRAGQLAVALDHRDFVLLHQELQALGVLVDDALLALLNARPVEGDSGGVLQAEGGAIFHVVKDFGVKQQRFGRDAAHVEAGSSQVGVFFDDGGFQAQLSGADGRSVPSGPATDDGYIVDSVSHGVAPFYCEL